MNQNNSSIINFYSLSRINNCIGENLTIVINDLSSMNNNMSDYSIKNNKNNEISFICKKRKFFFTPSEENNDLRRFINNSSEQKGSNSLNKKEKQNNIKRRKYDNDLIMKKIKKRFLKDLKNKVNENLKSERCRVQFKYFPPLFADNLTKEINKCFLDKTLKDLFSTDFIKYMEDKNIKIENTDKSNYEHNKSVLNTLKRNPKYKKKFDFFNRTYFELFNEYLVSKEFEIAINDLKKEDEEYIKKYINKANNFMLDFIK